METRPSVARVAEHPRPDHFLLHISDTHLLAGGGRLYDSVDSERHLAEVMQAVETAGARPEAIIFTGDLADHGEPDAYRRIRAIVDPVVERLGSTVIWVMGNHDDRAAFREELLGEAVGTDREVDRVHDVNGLRVIVLDTSVPGHHHGEVTGAQLDWLAEELSEPAPHGSILALHHPPVPSVLDLAVSVELREQAALAEVLEGSDVRAILGGHLHYSSTAMFAGIPVSVASATCYTQDLTVPVGGTRGQNGARAFNLVHVYPQTVLHSVVPLGEVVPVSYVDAAESAARLGALGITIGDRQALPLAVEPPLTVPLALPVTTRR